MQTVLDILKAVGERAEIASECGVEEIAVYRWGKNASIPAKHWGGLLRVAVRNKVHVTPDMLVDAHDARGSQTNNHSPDDPFNFKAPSEGAPSVEAAE